MQLCQTLTISVITLVVVRCDSTAEPVDPVSLPAIVSLLFHQRKLRSVPKTSLLRSRQIYNLLNPDIVASLSKLIDRAMNYIHTYKFLTF